MINIKHFPIIYHSDLELVKQNLEQSLKTFKPLPLSKSKDFQDLLNGFFKPKEQ